MRATAPVERQMPGGAAMSRSGWPLIRLCSQSSRLRRLFRQDAHRCSEFTDS